ncbi:hypothetical protein QTP88_026420 [Uroleucon formosanum]
MDKTPVLTTSVPTFNYDKPLFVNTTPADMVVDDSTITDNTNESSYSNLSVSTPAPADSNVIKNSLRLNQQSFPSDYIGPIFILVESINTEINLGKWHPVKAAKFFSTNFTGITNIKPAGFKKVKITFDSIENGNMCLKSAFLSDHGFSASIPSNLIYSFGVIKFDIDISEDDFREGLSSLFPIESFRRITVNKDGVITPTRLVELKFISPNLPQHITVFNMIFEVTPSIRSPVQCNRCLRFGHTQKFCRNDPRCSHCGGVKHSIVDFPTVSATEPSCLFCHLPHLATDRSCHEWSIQKEIKKIMATDNISYQDAVIFKKNNCYSSAFKYSDVTNRQPPVSNSNVPKPTHYVEDFPNLNDSHHFFNSKKPKSKARPLSPTKMTHSLSSKPCYSPPNGFFDIEWEVEKSAGWLVYWAFFKNMTNGDASLACVAYRGFVFTDKENVCEKGVADSNAGDGNILTSVEVRRSTIRLLNAYYGKPKPGDCNEFLEDFMNELCHLISVGVKCGNKHVEIVLEALTCDSPAKSFILNIILVCCTFLETNEIQHVPDIWMVKNDLCWFPYLKIDGKAKFLSSTQISRMIKQCTVHHNIDDGTTHKVTKVAGSFYKESPARKISKVWSEQSSGESDEDSPPKKLKC